MGKKWNLPVVEIKNQPRDNHCVKIPLYIIFFNAHELWKKTLILIYQGDK